MWQESLMPMTGQQRQGADGESEYEEPERMEEDELIRNQEDEKVYWFACLYIMPD